MSSSIKFELSNPALMKRLRAELQEITADGLSPDTIVLFVIQSVLLLGKEKTIGGHKKKEILLAHFKGAIGALPEEVRPVLDAMMDSDVVGSAVDALVWMFKEGKKANGGGLFRGFPCLGK